MRNRKLKLVKFPNAMERGEGKRNIALLARRAKNDQVRRVVCFYESEAGDYHMFWHNAPPHVVTMACLAIQEAALNAK